MGKKGVEDMISEIEIFVENCKFSPLSTNKILVPKDELEGMLDELRLKLPSEIDRSKKIMRNKEVILTDARNRADAMIAEAQDAANKMVEESEIMQLANLQAAQLLESAEQQANEILANAAKDADDVRLGAMYYTQEQLDNVRKVIEATLETERNNYSHLIESLENQAFVVTTNENELIGQINTATGQVNEPVSQPEAQAAPQEPAEPRRRPGRRPAGQPAGAQAAPAGIQPNPSVREMNPEEAAQLLQALEGTAGMNPQAGIVPEVPQMQTPEQPAVLMQAQQMPEQPVDMMQAQQMPEQPVDMMQTQQMPEQPIGMMQAQQMPEQPAVLMQAQQPELQAAPEQTASTQPAQPVTGGQTQPTPPVGRRVMRRVAHAQQTAQAQAGETGAEAATTEPRPVRNLGTIVDGSAMEGHSGAYR